MADNGLHNVVLECLQQVTDPHKTQQATETLLKLENEAQYGVVLATVMANTALPFHCRQLAGVTLRRYVVKHWDDSSPKFQAPLVADAHKEQIRQILPGCLGDESSKIRTASSMAIAAVGNYDFPEKWPHLLELLIKLISDKQNPLFVQGSLRCLVLFAEDVTDQQLSEAIPILYPALLHMFQSGASASFPLRAQCRSILLWRIFASSLVTISVEAGQFSNLVSSLLLPTLPQFFELFLNIMNPATNEIKEVASFSLRTEVIAALNMLVEIYPSIMAPHIDTFLPHIFASLMQGYQAYTNLVVHESSEIEYDDDGIEIGISAFIYSTFDLFTMMLNLQHKKKYQKQMQKTLIANMDDLSTMALGYMQMSKDDQDLWEDDPNEVAAMEDDIIQSQSVRVSCSLFLTKLLEMAGMTAVKSITAAALKKLEEAHQLKTKGGNEGENWWKLQEAALLGKCSEPYVCASMCLCVCMSVRLCLCVPACLCLCICVCVGMR